MNDNWIFSDIPYTRPDVEALQARYDDLTRRARSAAAAEDLLQVVRERDALQQEVCLYQSIATIHAFHDVTDAFYQQEMQETLPRLETLDSQSLAMAIAESPFAPAVDAAFGPQLRVLLTLDHRLHAGGKELQARIAQLSAQYQQRIAAAKYQIQGETLSGGQPRPQPPQGGLRGTDADDAGPGGCSGVPFAGAGPCPERSGPGQRV